MKFTKRDLGKLDRILLKGFYTHSRHDLECPSLILSREKYNMAHAVAVDEIEES
jgi:hypothetical protein